MANINLHSNKKDAMARRREGAMKRSQDMPPRPPKKGEGSKAGAAPDSAVPGKSGAK